MMSKLVEWEFWCSARIRVPTTVSRFDIDMGVVADSAQWNGVHDRQGVEVLLDKIIPDRHACQYYTPRFF